MMELQNAFRDVIQEAFREAFRKIGSLNKKKLAKVDTMYSSQKQRNIGEAKKAMIRKESIFCWNSLFCDFIFLIDNIIYFGFLKF